MAAVQQAPNMPNALRRRLLNDIAEIQREPYPNTHLHVDDANIQKACLILTPEDEEPLHLSITFYDQYPLNAPSVSIQSQIAHPNVFGNYICASILNTTEGWTPAYTLKGIIIQLLSFFCSESLEQDHGMWSVNIEEYKRHHYSNREPQRLRPKEAGFSCSKCGFGPDWYPDTATGMEVDQTSGGKAESSSSMISKLLTLPDEVMLLTLAEMETRDILTFAETIPRIKTMVASYDLIRIRELQCFTLKKSLQEAKLGVGVAVSGTQRRPVFRSEFDLLSQEAFFQHNIRRSIQGVGFDKWLPLPLSRRHWNLVRNHAGACLQGIQSYARMTTTQPDHVDVLYTFMNNIVVQFSADAEKDKGDSKSTLSHASEKAVEAYFALFHLLLCLATENPSIIQGANRIVSRFLDGPRGKSRFPDLGHVLVAALISDHGLTEDLIFKIIKEAILRNVVWMLDTKGAGLAELGYLEPSDVSDYRLIMTFHASRTSYRLLMFLKLFSSAARPRGKTLPELRDALFDTHGAPPPSTSTAMAAQIRKIHKIDGWPAFLKAMGIQNMPGKAEFTSFLRRTITESRQVGYSCIPMNQSQLYTIRKAREPKVEKKEGVVAMDAWYQKGEKWYNNGWNGRPSFFPGDRRDGGARDSGDRRAGGYGGARRGR